ncbi:transposase [Halonotius roseus]|uniref:Tc1-like transposase DDE domain-containing protein n=1 Tax=Halonotius roseus TaxID=2511997 RepID=A0A544QRH4_9EURY|nr:hypothetical protein EWF95_03635 [Halonotius roseus]
MIRASQNWFRGFQGQRVGNVCSKVRILLICDNFSSHFPYLIDHVVESLEITRVSLPSYSPDLNPIEPTWNCVHRDLSPRDADTIETFLGSDRLRKLRP